MSMAAGEYVSVSSQADVEAADLSIERHALATNHDSELDELTPIYIERGLTAELANQVQLLETGDISPIIPEKDQSGAVSFKIIKMITRTEDHVANYDSDYIKIKELALRNKQTESIKKWQTDKLKDTYIKIGDEFKECVFISDWIQ
ncbi:MAG: VIT1/CCC1 transporter family protein, partial [Nonlabens sp.]|nr:VIT1/CCC1 transporter family protein [Nonlabens sp.]